MTSEEAQAILRQPLPSPTAPPNPASQGTPEFQAILKQQAPLPLNPGVIDYLKSLGGFDVARLNDDQKRLAIGLSTLAIPGGLASRLLTLAKDASGAVRALSWLAGMAGEGALAGGGVQAVGNVATGNPVLQGVGPAATTGALTGTLLGAAGSQMPAISPEAQALMKQGIVPTVGQAVGQGNLLGQGLGKLEEASSSVLGPLVTRPRARAQQEWRDTVMNRVNPEGAPPLAGSTQDRIGQAQKALSQRFDEAAAMVDIPVGSQLYQAWLKRIEDSLNDPNKGLTQSTKDAIDKRLADRLMAAEQVGANGQRIIPGPLMQDIESSIGHWQHDQGMASTRGGWDASESRQAAQALGDIKQGLRDTRAQLSPEAAAIYADIRPKYSDYKAIEGAAKSAAGDIGAFSTLQLLRSLGKKTPPSTFTSGGAPGSLLESAYQARPVFRNYLPNSGTADRTLPWLLSVGATGGVGYGLGGPMGAGLLPLVAAGALWAGGTRPGQNLLLHAIQAGQDVGPGARLLASGLAPSLLNNVRPGSPLSWLTGSP